MKKRVKLFVVVIICLVSLFSVTYIAQAEMRNYVKNESDWYLSSSPYCATPLCYNSIPSYYMPMQQYVVESWDFYWDGKFQTHKFNDYYNYATYNQGCCPHN